MRQSQCLVTIADHTETAHLGRVFRLQKATTQLLVSIDKKGALHADTDQALRKYYKVYSRAKGSLKSCGRTKPVVDELFAIFDTLTDDLGLKQPAYLYETLNTFDEMKESIFKLLELDLKPTTRGRLLKLIEEVGKLSGIASAGDQHATFEAAIPVCRGIRLLLDPKSGYPLPRENPGLDYILDIQGLNDEFIEYAKIASSVEMEGSGDSHPKP